MLNPILSNLIDDEYEDLCYNLAYTTEPNIIAIVKLICGNSSKTYILKSLLNNRNLYNKIAQINEIDKYNRYESMIQLVKTYQYIQCESIKAN
jgi:hypothetical protein